MVYYVSVRPQGRARSLKSGLEARPADPESSGVRKGRGTIGRLFVHKGENINTRKLSFSESLILAQNERWQRGLGMQVERDREGSNILP